MGVVSQPWQSVDVRQSRPRVAVVGGGMAGLSAAWFLTQGSHRVTLFEARHTLGGRVRSITDLVTGMVIDTCQHVVLGCCTEFLAWCRDLQLLDCFERHGRFYFVQEGQQTGVLEAPRSLPAPLHLLVALMRFPLLSAGEKWRLLAAAWRLARSRSPGAPVCEHQMTDEFLRSTGQTRRVVDTFWAPLLISAASETLENIPVALARQIVREMFFAHRNGHQLWLPRIPLSELCDRRIRRALEKKGVRIECGVPLRAVTRSDHGWQLLFSGQQVEVFDAVVLAVPWWVARRLLPQEVSECVFHGWPEQTHQRKSPEAAAISGVHLWFDRPGFDLPHAVLPGRLAQWVFRPAFALPCPGELKAEEDPWYCHVVISAAHRLLPETAEECIAQVVADLRACFPALRVAQLRHARLITEPAAVLSPRPEWWQRRPTQETGFPGLVLAGDWTATGWPGTMESAVRSGKQAASELARNMLPRTGSRAALGR